MCGQYMITLLSPVYDRVTEGTWPVPGDPLYFGVFCPWFAETVFSLGEGLDLNQVMETKLLGHIYV